MYAAQSVNDVLQCGICMDRFQVPKILPCHHTFCSACLQRIFNSSNHSIDCPTCRKRFNLARGVNQLATNYLISNLLEIKPAKAKCPSCDKIESLMICEHCQTTQCADCLKNHLEKFRQSTRSALDRLSEINQNELELSTHASFKVLKDRISDQFQEMRYECDAILLKKQIEILRQVDEQRDRILEKFQQNLTPLEKTKSEFIGKPIDLTQKNEPELLSFLSKLSDLESEFQKKITEHENELKSTEVVLNCDIELIKTVREMCASIKLQSRTDGEAQVPLSNFSIVQLSVRSYLNREIQIKVRLDQTILDVKRMIGKQENIDPNRISLMKAENFFDRLDDQRTLSSYDIDSSTTLMISVL